MAQAARFFAKVYNTTGVTFRRVLGADILLSIPRIVREVNKPCGDLTLDIALPWDDFGYGSTINLFDLVKIWAINAANPSGLLVYQGHIEEITGNYTSGANAVSLRLFPIDALLNRSLRKAGADYVKAYASKDVDFIFGDTIDDVNTIYGTFFTKNLTASGGSYNRSFTNQRHFEILKKAAELLPATWYWRIRANGQIDLAQFNDATADHRLVVEQHVDSIHVVKSAMEIKNKEVLYWGVGGTLAEYNDSASETAYGRRMFAPVIDAGITDLTTADARGNGDVARQKDPTTKTVLTVNSNYAIETILPGDTVRVVNISNNTSQMISGVLRVLRVDYDGSIASLQLADIVDNFGNELSKLLPVS